MGVLVSLEFEVVTETIDDFIDGEKLRIPTFGGKGLVKVLSIEFCDLGQSGDAPEASATWRIISRTTLGSPLSSLSASWR